MRRSQFCRSSVPIRDLGGIDRHLAPDGHPLELERPPVRLDVCRLDLIGLLSDGEREVSVTKVDHGRHQAAAES